MNKTIKPHQLESDQVYDYHNNNSQPYDEPECPKCGSRTVETNALNEFDFCLNCHFGQIITSNDQNLNDVCLGKIQEAIKNESFCGRCGEPLSESNIAIIPIDDDEVFYCCKCADNLQLL